MTSSRNSWLLGLAISLAAVKFLLIPLLDYFEQSRTELVVLTDRLDRSVGVVQNRAAIEQTEQILQRQFAELDQRIPKVASADIFRLELQQRLGDIVSSSGCRLEVFDWVVEDARLGPGLHFARARLQVAGTVQALAAMQVSLEGGLNFASVREARFRTDYRAGFDTAGANMTLVVDLLFRPDATP